MKRYWLFFFNAYYPIGGMDDYEESFDSIDEAWDYLKTLEADVSGSYYQIFDSKTFKIVNDGKITE